MSVGFDVQTHLVPQARLAERRSVFSYFREPSRAIDVLKDVNNPNRRVSDGRLGLFDDRIKLLGGSLIAALGTLGLSKRILGVGEFLGFMGFFGAMTATPKALHLLVKLRTGLDMNHHYISPDGERRWLFQDPNYLPLHLLPEEEINKVGKKLKIPEDTPDRRRVIENKIRQVVSQSLTWWMLIAGPATPVLASAFAHFLEDPVKAGLSWANKQYHKGLLAISKEVPEMAESSLKSALNQITGAVPESSLSRWWQNFGNGIVKHSGLAQKLNPKETVKYSESEMLEKLIAHFREMAGDAETRKALGDYLNSQKEYLAKLEAEAENLIRKHGSENAAKHGRFVSDRLATARSTIAHYEQILNEIASGEKPSARTLKNLIRNPRVAEIERLIKVDGNIEQAQKLAGNKETFQKVKELINKEQFARASEYLGDSPGHHLQTALNSFFKKGIWRRRALVGLGGGLAAATLAFTWLVLGRAKEKHPKNVLTGEQMKNKYGASSYEVHQNELEKLHAIRAALGPRPNTGWRNNLKPLFNNNQAVIYALNLRSFGAQDRDRNGRIELEKGESGTFLSAIRRLDELKAMGVNTIHLLPLNPVGTIKRKGEAGSIYAPSSLLALNAEYDTPGNTLNVYQEARKFIQEAHRRGIHVMVDIPSAASIDLALNNPDLIATDSQGYTLTPTTWADIVMFENNKKLMDYYNEFFKLMADDLGVDGFRVDVARARPTAFWKHFIDKYPQHAWLAETYVYEAASPLENVPRDIPDELLRAGFDSIYGQMHIFHQMRTASEYQNYLLETNRMFKQAAGHGKSMIGSFLTHDDEETLMAHGGVTNSFLVSGLMATQPWTNPYILDGFTTGFNHRIDIFNYKQPPRGNHPEIGRFLGYMMQLRENYKDLLTTGLYIPIPVISATGDQIIAFARYHQGKTLLVVANKDVNARHRGKIYVPGLKPGQTLANLAPEYGRTSEFKPARNTLEVNLGPGRFHMFEIDTPMLPYYLQSY